MPPDGQPVILGPDHATLGGYPIVATVIEADLARVGRLTTGDHVWFEEVTIAEALELKTERDLAIAHAVTGAAVRLGDSLI
jgi:allophanate hydrolase subunit 2